MSSVSPYYVAFTVPVVLAAEYALRIPFLTLGYAFGLVPLVDAAVGTDSWNPTEEETRKLSKQRKFKHVLYAWVAVQLGVLAATIFAASTDASLTRSQWIGLATAMGVVSGLGINVAHELFHKLDRVDKLLGKALLVATGYGHFAVEHVYGHHKKVATPDDPASARLGESFWAFYPRTVSGSLSSAWNHESDRLRRAGSSAFSPANSVLQLHTASAAMAAAAWAFCGASGLAFFLAQAWVGFTLLEIVNYVEHYGLRRQQLANGTYEPVNETHSWNAPHAVTNYLLFKLQRHSDHHAHALREYQVLRSFDTSPQLPTGYAGMAVLALLTPLWRAVMDPRVARYYKST